ncbi:C-terminus of histone H2A, putative [Leishmania shawi]|uniref:Histone H2A n=1 Tax=Leishmania shawi TaxID=5680 RepID=A0ABR3E3Z3_9TRYP
MVEYKSHLTKQEEVRIAAEREEIKRARLLRSGGESAAAQITSGSLRADNAANAQLELSAKAGLIFPVGRIGQILRRGQYARRIGAAGAVYMAAVVEYLTAELLELSVKAATQSSKKPHRLNPRTLMMAVRHDEDLGALLKSVTLARSGVVPSINKVIAKKGGKKSKATPSA